MSNRYDIAIVGSGPAGLSAAVNAKIRNKKIILFGNPNFSNKLIKAPKIENYLGLFGISGAELKEKFKSHLDAMGINVVNEKINTIYAMGDYFSLMVNDKVYEATVVILTVGMENKKPLQGEEKFLGKGVGYCATCDASLYKGKIVTIIGYNKEAEEDANYVSEIASKLYYIPMYRDKYTLNHNIELVMDIPESIIGDEYVSNIRLKNRDIATDGVFIMKDSLPPAQLVPGLEMENGHIKVSRDMKTNIDGCYAAGDCTGKPYQYMKSAGEGQAAALNAVSYIDSLSKKS